MGGGGVMTQRQGAILGNRSKKVGKHFAVQHIYKVNFS